MTTTIVNQFATELQSVHEITVLILSNEHVFGCVQWGALAMVSPEAFLFRNSYKSTVNTSKKPRKRKQYSLSHHEETIESRIFQFFFWKSGKFNVEKIFENKENHFVKKVNRTDSFSNQSKLEFRKCMKRTIGGTNPKEIYAVLHTNK